MEKTNELTKEEFIEDMDNFRDNTAPIILKTLDENQHLLSVEVLGLVSIIRTLVNNYGDEELMETAAKYLTYEPSSNIKEVTEE